MSFSLALSISAAMSAGISISLAGGACESFFSNNIDYAFEALLRANGYLDGKAPGAQLALNLVESGCEVGIFAVHLIHINQARSIVLGGVAPDLLGADFNSGGCADQDNGAFAHSQSRPYFTYEIRVARSIDDIDLVILPGYRQDGQVDGDLVFDLIGVVVRGGGSVGDIPHAGDGACIEEHGFSQ